MRYIVQFMDGTSKRISEEEGTILIKCLNEKKPVILKGAWFPTHQITAVKPINKTWFDKDMVEIESKKQLTQVKDIKVLPKIV